MLDLNGRVALVIGGGAGMGLEISRRLAAAGATLAISYAHSAREAEAAAPGLGANCSVHQADLRAPAQADALVHAVVERHQRLDVLVNCAGATRFIAFENLEAITEEIWDDLLDINLKAAFFVSRAAGTWMRDHTSGGVIVHVSSTAAFSTRGSSLPYNVAKAAVIQLTRILAQALAPAVRVNAVAPGTVATRWWDTNPTAMERARDTSLFRRLATVQDVADAAVHLVTNESMSGQTVVVDLGNVMH